MDTSLILLLASFVVTAGCIATPSDSASVQDPPCMFGGPPREPPVDRQPLNLTDAHLDEHPRIAELFNTNASHVPVDCQQGRRLLEHLASEGADVNFREHSYGHDVYLAHDGTTIHALLSRVA